MVPVAEFSNDMTDTRCFARSRLAFENHRLPGTAYVEQYFVVVWRSNERKLREALRSKYLFE